MRAGKIVLLIFGIIFVIIAIGMLASGGIVLGVENRFRDNQGYYASGLTPVSAPAPAIISRPADIHIGSWWFFGNRDPVSVKIEAVNSNSSQPIFIGIARETDLNTYLSGISYNEITGFSVWPRRIEDTHFSGATTAPAPASQTFWVAQTSGTGTQTITWNVESGTYSLILMNENGSSPVNAEISLGIKIPEIVRGVAIGLLVVGFLFLVGGGLMIYFAIR